MNELLEEWLVGEESPARGPSEGKELERLEESDLHREEREWKPPLPEWRADPQEGEN